MKRAGFGGFNETWVRDLPLSGWRLNSGSAGVLRGSAGPRTLSGWAAGERRFTPPPRSREKTAPQRLGVSLPGCNPRFFYSNVHPLFSPSLQSRGAALPRKELRPGGGGGKVPAPCFAQWGLKAKMSAPPPFFFFLVFFPPSSILKIDIEAFQCHLVGEGRASLFVPRCCKGIC